MVSRLGSRGSRVILLNREQIESKNTFVEGLIRLYNGSSRLGDRLVDYTRRQVDYMTIVCVIKAFNKNSKNTQK